MADNDSDTGNQKSTNTDRSRVLEIIGLLSAIGFFIGIYFAWRTQVNGLITQEQFDHIRPGQTLAQVESILGATGQKESADLVSEGDETSASNEIAAREVYVWKNSSDSKVTGIFEAGVLVDKSARNLP